MTEDGDGGLGLTDLERENTLLVGIIEAISTGPELGPLAASVARLIVEATGTDVCFVHVLDDGGGALTLTGATPPFDVCAGKIQLPVGEGVSGWVASHRSPAVIFSEKEADTRYRYFPELGGRAYTSMVSVPMESGLTGLVGVLNVHTKQRREFTERDVRLLVSIGQLVAGAVHQARLHRRLTAREQAAERFAEQVIAAQEAERRRLAGDIHDGITQRLVSLAYHLDAAADAVSHHVGSGSAEGTTDCTTDGTTDGTLAERELARARELTDLTLLEAHAALAGLRPPVLEDLGLADALASLARSVAQLPVSVRADDRRLPEHMEIAIYRIAQEALQNVVKHAGATSAAVELRCDAGRAHLRVSDDGHGFDVTTRDSDPSSYGLRSMAERAELIGGRLDVTSRPGIGTTVTATVPVPPVGLARQRHFVPAARPGPACPDPPSWRLCAPGGPSSRPFRGSCRARRTPVVNSHHWRPQPPWLRGAAGPAPPVGKVYRDFGRNPPGSLWFVPPKRGIPLPEFNVVTPPPIGAAPVGHSAKGRLAQEATALAGQRVSGLP